MKHFCRLWGRLVGRLVVCLVVLAAAACESTPPDYYYLQSLGPAEAGVDDYQARLMVEEVTLPTYLNRSDIVTQQQANRLDVAETEKWAEPLDEGVARVLRADLAHLLAERRVLVAPRDFTDPDAVEWWKDKHRTLLDQGADALLVPRRGRDPDQEAGQHPHEGEQRDPDDDADLTRRELVRRVDEPSERPHLRDALVYLYLLCRWFALRGDVPHRQQYGEHDESDDDGFAAHGA